MKDSRLRHSEVLTMKPVHLLSAACIFVVTFLVALPAPARADCPDKPIKCDFGFIGSQGTCWRVWRCVTCGAKKCPQLPARTYREVPRRAEFACIDHAIRAGETNGCSNPSPDPASGFYRGFFKPACDQQDLCYLNTLGLSKGRCDDDFKANMEWMCDTYFTGAANLTQRGSCRAAAGTWWAVLATDLKSGPLYDKAQAWSKANCPAPTPPPTPPVTPPSPPPASPPTPPVDASSPVALGFYSARHPHWGGQVIIASEGRYARDNGDPGTWTFDGQTLTLRWTNWGPEHLTRVGPDQYRAPTYAFSLELAEPIHGTYRAAHPHWGGTVTLNADGTYARDNGDPGTWTFDGRTLTLRWRNWGPESLTRVGPGSYRADGNGFTLTRP